MPAAIFIRQGIRPRRLTVPSTHLDTYQLMRITTLSSEVTASRFDLRANVGIGLRRATDGWQGPTEVAESSAEWSLWIVPLPLRPPLLWTLVGQSSAIHSQLPHAQPRADPYR